MGVPRELLHQRRDKYVRAIGPFIDRLKVAFDIAVAQTIEAIAMMAMPSTNVFDITVHAFSVPKHLFLKLSIGKKFNRGSPSVWTAGQKIRDDDSIIAIATFFLLGQIDVANILSALLTCWVAVQFVQDVLKDTSVKNDVDMRGHVLKHRAAFCPASSAWHAQSFCERISMGRAVFRRPLVSLPGIVRL